MGLKRLYMVLYIHQNFIIQIIISAWRLSKHELIPSSIHSAPAASPILCGISWRNFLTFYSYCYFFWYSKHITVRVAVVKGNAYGHGAIPASRYLMESGAIDRLAVATVMEAIQLRRAGVGGAIHVLGKTIDIDLIRTYYIVNSLGTLL